VKNHMKGEDVKEGRKEKSKRRIKRKIKTEKVKRNTEIIQILRRENVPDLEMKKRRKRGHLQKIEAVRKEEI